MTTELVDSKVNTQFNLLYPMPKGYHILPPGSISQDNNMSRFRIGIGKKCNIKWLYQKDGSRFKTLHFSKLWGIYDIVEYLTKDYEIRGLIHEGVEIQPGAKDTIEDIIAKRGLVKNGGDIRCVVYWTHTFLNGFRIVPVLIDTISQRFFNMVNAFPEFFPEDSFGLLMEDLRKLEVSGLKVEDMEIISYLSTIRMCPKCGVVSNIEKPKKYPWLYYMQTGKYQEQTRDNLGNGIFVKKSLFNS